MGQRLSWMEEETMPSQLKFRALKEEAYQRLHRLQLKKNHPLTWGSSSDRKIDKEMDEIFKNSENFLGDD